MSAASRLSGFFNTIALKLLRKQPSRYLDFLYGRQLHRLDAMAKNGTNPFHVADFSREHYETYDDRELLDNENPRRGWDTIVDGEIRWLPAGEIRRRYIELLRAEIDAAIAAGAEPSVLEVGCGNCINLASLKRIYGDRITLAGFDVAQARIDVGKRHYGAALDGIDLRAASVFDPDLPQKFGRKFGIVYSMHCLEQLPNFADKAVENMTALSSGRVVMMEPDWDLAHPAQRLFLIVSDHMRTLLATCRARGLHILKAEQTAVQSSLKNPTTLIVVDVRK